MGPPGRLKRQKTKDLEEQEETTEHPELPDDFSREGGPIGGDLRTYLLPPSPSHFQQHSLEPIAGPSQHSASSLLVPTSPTHDTSIGTSFPRASSGSDEESPIDTHIPRAPNAFILFRSHMIRTQAIPKSVEGKNKDLSKIIGTVWQGLNAEERAHWEREAQNAQRLHRLQYPDWRFAPGIQRGEVSASKRRKRKADGDGEAAPARKRPRRAKAKQAKSSDSDAKVKGDMKEEEGNDDAPMYSPSSPSLPYSFTIPLGSPTARRPSLPLPKTKTGKEKVKSLPAAGSSRPPPGQRRTTAQDRPHSPLVLPQASSSPSMPSEMQLVSNMTGGVMSFPVPSNDTLKCEWTGHELDYDSSPSPYADHLDSPGPSTSVDTSSHQPNPYHLYSSSSAAQSLPSPGYPHDLPSGPFSPTHHPSPTQRYDQSNFPRSSNPLSDDLDYSHSMVPLTHRFRRGSMDHTRSPLSQSHTFDDLAGETGPLPWQSFSQTMEYPWSTEAGSASAYPSAIPPQDYSFGGAVSGGRPITVDDQSFYQGYSPHHPSHSPVASSSTLSTPYPMPTYNFPGPSELSHALHFDDDPSRPPHESHSPGAKGS